MKKFLLSAGVIIVFAFYVIFTRGSDTTLTPSPSPVADNTQQPSPTPSAPPPSPTPSPTPAPTPKPSPAPVPVPAPTPPPVKKTYNDGSYTGSLTDAFYGNVQVKAVIQNGRITDVQFLDYPSDSGHSAQVSRYSMPLLKQEAIAAQSANVDIVSGATQTSEAFRQSLASALSQAKA